MGAQILLRALETGAVDPRRVVLMPNPLHRPRADASAGAWRRAPGAVPGLDRALTQLARAAFRPEHGVKLTASATPAARDLVRHAFADVGGNVNLARSWARLAKRWPSGPRRELLDLYPRLRMPVLLLWADEDHRHPLQAAEEALDLLPGGQLRILGRRASSSPTTTPSASPASWPPSAADRPRESPRAPWFD